MSLIFSKPDDSPLDSISLTAERGVPSTHVPFKVLNDGSQPVEGAYVVLYAETSPGSGVYRTDGQPAVDERMGRIEITGQDSSATPGQQVVLGQVQPVGHLAVALLPTILAGDWILGDFWIEQGGSSAGGGAINLKLEIANERTAYPLPFGVSKVGNGIDTGRKQFRSFPIEGLEFTASGSPDNEVHVAAGRWLILGEEYEDADGEDIPFSANDVNSDTLAAGESYIAAISAGVGGFSVTKGVKDTTPDRPSPPGDEILLAWITISYTGSTPIIQTSDIDQAFTYGRYRPVAPATGLSVEIHAGEAIIADFGQVRQNKSSVALAASSLNRVWLEWTGVLTVTTSDVPPTAGAVKICTAQTNGTDVTALTDTRRYIAIGDGTGGGGTLEVATPTDSPSVVAVTRLVFPEGSLTDNGGGEAEVAFPADSLLIHKDGSVAFTANQSMGSHKLTSVTDPTSAQDAATKAYVDSAVGGFALQIKQSVRVATTVNGTFSTAFDNGSVVDGVTLATGDRILLKNQSTASQNGIYIVPASGSPSRAGDADISAEVTAGLVVFVEEGTSNAGTGWILTTPNPITLGSTGLTFTKFTAAPGAVTTAAETVTLSTGSNDDVALANTTALVNVVKLSLASGSATLTGFVAPAFGQILMVASISGANVITVAHADSGSSAGNRFLNPQAIDFDLDAQDLAFVAVYDLESLAWRAITVPSSGAGGGSISVTDGSTTVDPCTDIEFTSGATVTDAGGGLAQVAISGGGGGGEIGWEAGSVQTLLTTELNSLASTSASNLGSAYDNGDPANLYLYGDFVLTVAFGSSPTLGTPVNLFLVPATDGTNYGTADSTHIPANCGKGSFHVFNQTSSQKLIIQGVVLPPTKFKVMVENGTNQAFTSSGNTVEMLPYREQLT